MTITPEQRERRRQYIGSSDASAILGLNPPGWPNEADVWVEKMFGTKDATSMPMLVGDICEPGLVEWCAVEKGLAVERDKMIVHAKGVLAANLDGDARPEAIIESKTSAMDEEWGVPGTDQVPERVLVQVHHQFYVTGATLCWVPALTFTRYGAQAHIYRVDRDDGLCEAIADELHAWWDRHIVAKEAPSESRPQYQTMRAVIREPETEVEIDPEVFRPILEASQKKKRADKVARLRKERREALLAAAMLPIGNSEKGVCELGTITIKEDKRGVSRVTVKEVKG